MSIKDAVKKVVSDWKERVKYEYHGKYQPKTEEERRNRERVLASLAQKEKEYKMLEGARKGIMTQDEYELRRGNILRRREKNKGRKD